jgi:class 3 adenylate cyclase
MNCQSCGQENRTEARFCDACGAPLRAPSHHSPRSYTPAHLAQKVLTTRSALEGERKQVTVLFCDLANSTELARCIGAEAMHDLLNAFFELALAEVHQVEGTINQFLGDGFMALFGAPVAHEDHVRRALMAALAIQQRLREASEGLQPALAQVHLRMGLNTGPVVVGRIGDNLRMDYTAVGDTTNVAARLQTLARPGGICVSDSVHDAGVVHFEFQSIGHHALKGIATPVSVFEVLRMRPRPDQQAARALGVASALVGRDAELAAIGAAMTALRDGRGDLLLLTGEPGSGKSRLVAEARRAFAGGPLRWLEGRSLSFGRNLSYLPFREILKTCVDIADDDTEATAWRKLDSGLAALFGDHGADMLPYLGTVLALRVPPEMDERVKYLDGQGLRRQVFLCMRQLVERLARERPLVLLLEDWHWADQSSVDLAEHLLPLAHTVPLLVFVASRLDPPEPAERVRRFAAEHESARLATLELAPLDAGHSATLIANLVGTAELPPALREQILRRTEGNPFFIEEVIRSLVTDGVLVRHAQDSGWHLARPADAVQLPDTVQGLILARIDRLDDETKHALKLASVIGRSFFDRVLETIADRRQQLPAQLAELQQAELIRDKQRAPEPEHIFKHALVQEATYGSLLADQRRTIHQRVALAIEALFGDRIEEFTSLLAHHYTCAEDWDKAQAFLFRAGDQAGRVAADAEALEHFRRAEQAYVKAHGDRLTPLQRAALARKVGAALYGTGQYEAAHEQMRLALGHLGIVYPTSRGGVLGAILKFIGGHFWRRARRALGRPAAKTLDTATATEVSTIAHLMAWMDYFLDKERMLLDSLLELHVGETSDYAMAEARGLSSLAFGYMTFSARTMSRQVHGEAVAVAERSGHPSAISFAWFALGFLDFYDGRWDDCEIHMRQAIAAYRDTGDIHRWGGAALMLSFVIAFRGDFAQARTLTESIVRAGEDAADPQVASWGLQNLGYVQIAEGPLEEAVRSLRGGQRLAIAIPAWDNLLYQKALCAKAMVLLGRLDEAAAEIDEAHRIIVREKRTLPYDQVEVLTATAALRIARAEAAIGQPGQAAALQQAHAAAAKALHCARQMPLWLPQALRMSGTAEWLAGHSAAAERLWRESVAVAQASKFPIEHGLGLLEIGKRLDQPDATAQAAALFERTGAHTYLAMAGRTASVEHVA